MSFQNFRWRRANQMSNPTDKTPDEKDLLLDHDYDGIQELDYPLPRWWLNLFYLTMVFAVFYAGYYMTIGPTLSDELKVAMKDIKARQPKQIAGADGTGDALKAVLAMIKKPEATAMGKEVFTGKCAACHGQNAEGSIGPNLTDDFWLHGGHPKDVVKTIREGVGDKGMPPWGALLKDEEVYSLVAYIRSIRGTQPANAKQAQGEKVEFQEL
jgi:cytochrome c oxidase cbb3-type subunit III